MRNTLNLLMPLWFNAALAQKCEFHFAMQHTPPAKDFSGELFEWDLAYW
jgi:hypothetical protein